MAIDEPDDRGTAGTPEARFGAELRRLRVRAELSVRALAQELHRSHSSIVEYERGQRLPGVEVVEQYEEFFGLARGTLAARRERARAERLDEPRDATVDEQLGDVACPYKGLRAFEYEDAGLFFGREAQVERVVARLAEVRFVAVVGASGSGKSSFVRAGLLPGIASTFVSADTGPLIALLTPGERPVDELARAVQGAIDAPVLADELRAHPARLGHVTCQGAPDGLVLLIDQFEELFALCAEEAERRCFVDALLAAWRDPASPVTVVVALRADFYGRIAPYPELAAAVVAHQALIGPMSHGDLRRAIELPAAQTGLLLQAGLVETILEDLAGEPGALPLLSHALLETWKRRRRLTLTLSGYREAGGVSGAIARTAERTLHSLSQADQETARSIFLRLTDVSERSEPTRRRVDRTQLAAHPRADASLDRVFGILADARLVTIDERTVMVAHEALIRHWPRLRSWVEADRAGLLIHRHLADAAREWSTLQRESSALYRGARLAIASEWATDHEDELSPLERDFLIASRASDRRRIRRRNTVRSALAGLTAVAALLAAWALNERSAARHQASQATALALTSAASPLLDRRPDVSLLLAFEAYRASPRAETTSAVLSALRAARDPGLIGILRGHSGPVFRMAFSRDGRTLATASDDRTIRRWDTRTHKAVGKPMKDPGELAGALAFSPDGGTLASRGDHNTIRLWDLRAHRQIGQPLRGHTTFPSASAGPSRSLNIVLDAAFSPDGSMLASTGYDGIRLWDVRTRKPVGVLLAANASAPTNVTFSRDGHTLAAADQTGVIRLWNVRTRERQGAALNTGGVMQIAFSPDGRTIASAGFDRAVRLWSLRSSRQLGRPITTSRLTHSVAFSPDGRWLASGGLDKRIRLWDVRTHKQVRTPLVGHSEPIGSVAFSPDGKTLASAGGEPTVRLWNVHAPTDRPLTGHTDRVRSVAFSRDGRTLASTGLDETIRLWDAVTRRQLGVPLEHEASDLGQVAFSPDGRTLVSWGEDHTIRLWDVRARKRLGAPLSGHTDLLSHAVFSPDGRMLASAGKDKTIRLWDAHTHRQLGAPLTGHTDVIFNLAFSSDGRTLASIAADKTIRLWDTRRHKQAGKPITSDTDASSIAFDPTSTTLAAAGQLANTIQLWDTRTRKPHGGPLTGHTDVLHAITFSPDGRMLASASEDKTVRLWDARAHQPLGPPLAAHASGVLDVAFSPDGRTLASAGADKTIRLWPRLQWRHLTDLQAQVCKLVGSGLSKAEWAQYAPGITHRDSCR